MPRYQPPTYEQLRDATGVRELMAEMETWPDDRRRWWHMMEAFAGLPAGPGGGSGFDGVRPPRWMAAAAREELRHLSQRWSQWAHFTFLRALERLGLVTFERDDTYVLAMVSALGSRWLPEGDQPSRAEVLRRDAELVEHILWRVFEVEGGGEVSLTNVDKYSAADEATWRHTFLELVGDGTLPRARVLRCCLEALARDFSAYRAGWYSGLYLALRPTPAEAADDQHLIRDLLRSTVAATVAFAARQLETVEKAGRLDDHEFVSVAAGAFAVPAKGTGLTVLRTLGRVADRRPDLSSDVVDAAAVGLEHPNGEVQRAGLNLLRVLGAADAVRSRLDALEPSVRRDAERWTGGSAEPGPADAKGSAAPMAPSGPEPSTMEVPGPDLPDRFAALLERASDPVEVELCLAALARLDDPAGTLQPLVKRATTVLRREHSDHAGSLSRYLATLVLAGRDVAHEPPTVRDRPLRPLVGRLIEVTARVRGVRPRAPLLATPTSPAGWIDPTVLAERLVAYDGEPTHHDLVAALLRVAPEGRPAARRVARRASGEAGAALRYALGGEPGEIGTPAVWVAAARSRDPLGDDEHLIKAGLDGGGQGRAAAYRLILTPNVHQYEDRGRTRRVTWWTAALEVDRPVSDHPPDQPTVVSPWAKFGALEWWGDWLPWAALAWPHDAEPIFALGFGSVMRTAHWGEVHHDAVRVLDVLLTHPGRLGPMAAATLAMGLSGGRADERTRAVDAFAALVPSGRIDATSVATAMATVAGPCTATRWAASLRDAAAVNPDAGRAVVAVLSSLLPRLGPDHAGLHALLDALREESVRHGVGVADPALRAWLGGITGATKAARAARALLAERELSTVED